MGTGNGSMIANHMRTLIMPNDKPDHPMIFFLFSYWHDRVEGMGFVGDTLKIRDMGANLSAKGS